MSKSGLHPSAFLRILNSPPVTVGLSALVCLWAAFYNGYPLVYSDTANYISSGMVWGTPITRPATYGIFLFLASFGGTTLWSVIFFQSAILACLVLMSVKHLSGARWPGLTSLAVMCILNATTGISWVASELIADIFTPVTVISLGLLLVPGKLDKWTKAGLYAIFLLAVATHISHMALSLVICLVVLVFFRRMKNLGVQVHRLKILGILMALAYITMTSSVAKSTHVFLVSHMHDAGILKPYLDEVCPDRDYAICAYKDVLPHDLMWDADSPVYKPELGWKESKAEFQAILADILTTPKYLADLTGVSLAWTGKQLVTFHVGSGNIPFDEGSQLDNAIAKHFPGELGQFRSSRQNEGTLLPVRFFDILNSITAACSFLFICIVLLWKKSREALPVTLKFFTGHILFSILLNAVICVSLVYVVDRFGCRVTWMLTFGALLVAIRRNSKF